MLVGWLGCGGSRASCRPDPEKLQQKATRKWTSCEKNRALNTSNETKATCSSARSLRKLSGEESARDSKTIPVVVRTSGRPFIGIDRLDLEMDSVRVFSTLPINQFAVATTSIVVSRLRTLNYFEASLGRTTLPVQTQPTIAALPSARADFRQHPMLMPMPMPTLKSNPKSNPKSTCQYNILE